MVNMTVMCYLQFYELEHEPCNLRNAKLMFKTIYARTDTFKYSFFFHRVVRPCSAVARGGAGGARAPPVFFLECKNRPV